MEQLLLSLSYWLHSLATVVFIGYFVLLAVIVLPVLAKPENGPVLSQISRNAAAGGCTEPCSFSLSRVFT